MFASRPASGLRPGGKSHPLSLCPHPKDIVLLPTLEREEIPNPKSSLFFISCRRAASPGHAESRALPALTYLVPCLNTSFYARPLNKAGASSSPSGKEGPRHKETAVPGRRGPSGVTGRRFGDKAEKGARGIDMNAAPRGLFQQP